MTLKDTIGNMAWIMKRAFISYSSEDEELAKSLHSFLDGSGIPTFLASLSIKPGTEWSKNTLSALNEAEWIFFIASKSACFSPFVQQELGATIIREKTLIPLLVDVECDQLPGWVSGYQAIDLRTGPEQLQKAVAAISIELRVDQFWAGVFFGALVVGAAVILGKR